MPQQKIFPQCHLDLQRKHASKEERAASLLKQSDHLKNTLNRVGGVRGLALRHVNAIQSATRKMPLEVLGLIFKFACPLDDVQPSGFHVEEEYDRPVGLRVTKSGRDPHLAVALSAVSTHWRDAALATTTLWSSMELEVQGALLLQQIAVLRLYLKRAKDVPFSLRLNFLRQHKLNFYHQRAVEATNHIISPEDLRDIICPENDLEPLRHLIFDEFAGKFGTLYLSSAPPEWLTSFSYSSFVKLENLSLFWIPGDHGPKPLFVGVDFSDLPQLRSLSISSVPFIQPIPSSVTTIYLERVWVETCARILFECPSLVEFCCEDPDYNAAGRQPRSAWLRDEISLKHLNVFSWTRGAWMSWEKAILEHLSLPALEHLEWGAWNKRTSLAPLLSRISAERLRSMRLDSFPLMTPADLTSILECTPNLEYLKLSRFRRAFLPILFRTLTPKGSRMLIPLVEEIPSENILSLPNEVNTSGERDSEIFLEMLKARRAKGMNFFTLGAWNHDLQWLAHVRDQLAEMIEDGFQLWIHEEMEEVEWLRELWSEEDSSDAS